jgi:RNA polymerase sigma factor (TIGR02999 family)
VRAASAFAPLPFVRPVDPESNAAGAVPDVLTELRSGRRESIDQLVPLVYSELHAIAHRHLSHRRDAAGQGTLVTAALVNEVYLKLVDQAHANWTDRAHFVALASVAMRHILIDRAKARRARKRGGSKAAVTFEDDAIAAESSPDALLEINDALDRLAVIDPRLARVVEYRFFGGLSEDEIAEVLDVTVRTVQRDWAKARVLLRRMLAG